MDRVKVDKSGQFRLAPLERIVNVSRAPQKSSEGFPASFSHGVKKRPKVYYSQLNPIAVWPAEFRAAQRLEPSDDWEDEDDDGDVQSLPPPRASAFDWASISRGVRTRVDADVVGAAEACPIFMCRQIRRRHYFAKTRYSASLGWGAELLVLGVAYEGTNSTKPWPI